MREGANLGRRRYINLLQKYFLKYFEKVLLFEVLQEVQLYKIPTDNSL